MSKLVASSHNTPCLHSKASPSLSLGSAEPAGVSLHPLFIQSRLQKTSDLNSPLSSSFAGVSDSGLPCCRHPKEALQQTQSLGHCASCGMKVTYHCDMDLHLRTWLHPPFSSERGTLNSFSVLPELLFILESRVTVGTEAPGNRTVPCSHFCVFLWWREPSSLIASGSWSAPGTPSCNEYNATLPKG